MHAVLVKVSISDFEGSVKQDQALYRRLRQICGPDEALAPRQIA